MAHRLLGGPHRPSNRSPSLPLPRRAPMQSCMHACIHTCDSRAQWSPPQSSPRLHPQPPSTSRSDCVLLASQSRGQPASRVLSLASVPESDPTSMPAMAVAASAALVQPTKTVAPEPHPIDNSSSEYLEVLDKAHGVDVGATDSAPVINPVVIPKKAVGKVSVKMADPTRAAPAVPRTQPSQLQPKIEAAVR